MPGPRPIPVSDGIQDLDHTIAQMKRAADTASLRELCAKHFDRDATVVIDQDGNYRIHSSGFDLRGGGYTLKQYFHIFGPDSLGNGGGLVISAPTNYDPVEYDQTLTFQHNCATIDDMIKQWYDIPNPSEFDVFIATIDKAISIVDVTDPDTLIMTAISSIRNDLHGFDGEFIKEVRYLLTEDGENRLLLFCTCIYNMLLAVKVSAQVEQSICAAVKGNVGSMSYDSKTKIDSWQPSHGINLNALVIAAAIFEVFSAALEAIPGVDVAISIIDLGLALVPVLTDPSSSQDPLPGDSVDSLLLSISETFNGGINSLQAMLNSAQLDFDTNNVQHNYDNINAAVVNGTFALNVSKAKAASKREKPRGQCAEYDVLHRIANDYLKTIMEQMDAVYDALKGIISMKDTTTPWATLDALANRSTQDPWIDTCSLIQGSIHKNTDSSEYSVLKKVRKMINDYADALEGWDGRLCKALNAISGNG